ncbi:complement factor H-related protein 5 isoform X3 [Pongo pygmaeus]|uniref:complement factor H-related protein 5 isoform X3 n=1 Tax=Pongo pygmaeus TaxID=9600 RepID=UPI0023E336E9|nr:complement factor H-related protein 5 isoform X3 [Pongo pygmaeus]
MKADLKQHHHHWSIFSYIRLRLPRMLLLFSVILISWVSTVGGEATLCDFPKIHHGFLYDEEDYNPFSQVPTGEVFYYSCEYNFVSPSKSFWTRITCTEEGWSPTPKCLKEECHVPILEANVDAQPKKESYKVGDVLKFSCRKNLIRVGPDSVQCYQFGWSPNFPTCKEQVRSCGPPPQLSNGEVKEIRKEEYGHNEVVEYDCNPNFIINGPKKIQCVDGEWTTLPTCVEQVKTCGYIPELEYGYVQLSVPPYQHGVSVEVNCRNEYAMIGNNMITCINGMWTELPVCVATHQLKRCKIAGVNIKALFKLSGNEFNHNARIRYRCSDIFRYRHSVCINGKWNPELHCTEKREQFCPPPPQIPNAQNMTTTVNYQDGEKVAVLCKENYLLPEAKEIVCKDGQWQSLPRCVESTAYCGPPPSINNGDITSFPLSVYPPGSTVTYRCQSFYKLQGSVTVTCRNKQWSEPPRCLDPCVVSEENMNKNNIQLKWRNDGKLYAKTGDAVEFQCKFPYKAKISSPSFRAICQEGKFEYPICE